MMLARVAENLYWMARNLERAENTARLINSTTYVLLDLPHGATFGWKNLAEIAGLDDLFAKTYPEANEESIMRFLIEDEANPSSIFACVKYARENTRTLREVLPAEMWERINSLYLYVRQNAQAACKSRRERYMVLNEIIQQRHAIVGLFSGTMPHDYAYQLIKLGRNIERADMTTRILDLHSAISFSDESVVLESLVERIWMSTLESLSAYQTYRRLVSMHVRSDDAVRFLLQDMRFPRSVAHCLSEMEACFRLMPKSQQLQQLTALLRLKIAQHATSKLDAVALHEYIDLLQMQLGEIHDALMQNYFHAWQDGVLPSGQTQGEMEFAQQ
jgi:uncharacterized alpha-E superfamily protein